MGEFGEDFMISLGMVSGSDALVVGEGSLAGCHGVAS